MNANHHRRSSTQFYQEDIVQHISDPNTYGIVLRCWHDVDDIPSLGPLVDPMMRPLQYGEVGVSFFPGGNRDILPESEFTIVDRSFQPGDLCKRSIDDVRSGVVLNVEVQGRLEHAISGAPVEGWKNMHDLESPTEPEIGDYVCYDDWIGQVVEMYDESVIEISGSHLVRLPELSSRLTVGETGNDILPPPMGVQNLFGFLTGSNRPNNSDTVVAVKHTVLAVCWLALNQSLDPVQASTRRRPDRLWFGSNLSKLVVVRGKSGQAMRVGDKVLLKESAGLPTTTHGNAGDPADVVVVKTLVVKQTRSTVTVLWQDGTQELVNSTALIPYLNPDEYDCWPGDHVIWKSEGERHSAVVQSVNATERTASIRYADTGNIDLVSVLELDAHGTSDSSVVAPGHSFSDGLGVRRGDFVFIHREGTTNGFEKPHVPRIGEVEEWVRENPVQTDGQLGGWRREMSDIGANIATRRGVDNVEEGQVRRVSEGDIPMSWFGEITGLHLDGTAEVTHPDSTVAVYSLERLTKLYDGMEQLEDGIWGDDVSEGQGSYEEDHEEIWSMEDDGVWRPHTGVDDADEWEETEDDEDEAMDVDIQEPGWADSPSTPPATYVSPLFRPGTPRAYPLADPSASMPLPPALTSLPPPTALLSSSDVPQSKQHEQEDEDRGGDDNLHWKRFDILPSAPPDHAFYSSPPAQPSKSFLGRLSREYRVLSNSLPESIIVRAYEDRTDLIRSLIIGPENTPYQDAPFVIDWMLDRSSFPNSPPLAHFHSWTNGNGRVNPNLYEEGKVCLSILGTWAGDKNETWNAARSSLLQAFVSIQGLVLVKEPWFCEPAYEKLRGTEEGIVNSRLYNEKAYVLSRGFVRRALETPLGGLQSEMDWLYYSQKRLEKVIDGARALIARSKSTSQDLDTDEAVPRLTAGGIITLGRTLSKLETLHART